jgi:hypothetical protein
MGAKFWKQNNHYIFGEIGYRKHEHAVYNVVVKQIKLENNQLVILGRLVMQKNKCFCKKGGRTLVCNRQPSHKAIDTSLVEEFIIYGLGKTCGSGDPVPVSRGTYLDFKNNINVNLISS